MAVSRITCPECKTVLRPAKPVPLGKAVKCPECGNRFAVSLETADEGAARKPKRAVDDDRDAPRKPKKSAEAAGSPKRPAAKAAAPGKKPAARPNDDDEGGGTYSFVEHGGDEDKPDIEYAPDMSIKDLRGPAQAALNRPSNALIAVGGVCFFGWLGLLVLILIPALFPIDNDEGDKTKPPKPVIGLEHGLGAINDDKAPGGDLKSDPARKSMFNFFGVDIAMFGALGILILLLFLSPIFVGMAYSGIVTYGAVKIQNLEGYGWGIAASIMVMAPICGFGVMASTVILGQFIIGILIDDIVWIRSMMGALMGIEYLICLGVGVWVLITMLSERVKAGYEYKPE
jgi:hypothetical protein